MNKHACDVKNPSMTFANDISIHFQVIYIYIYLCNAIEYIIYVTLYTYMYEICVLAPYVALQGELPKRQRVAFSAIEFNQPARVIAEKNHTKNIR